MNKSISKENDINETFEEKITSMNSLLKDIRKDYELSLSKLKNCDYTHILERLVSTEKDLKAVTERVNDLKLNVDANTDALTKINIAFQELTGSINQLKLIVDEFKENHKVEKENKINFVFQIIVPIILAVIFFLFGLFFKSCSSIHEQNVNVKKSHNNSYEYQNFESTKNK